MTASLTISAIDPLLAQVYRPVDAATRALSIRWVIIGATARDLIYEQLFKVRPRRGTRDVDLAIEVSHWRGYESLRNTLLADGRFRRCEREQQRLICTATGLPVDIVPFGGVDRDHAVSWPPTHDIRMSTLGLADALNCALTVHVEEEAALKLPVVHPAVLVATKFFAWGDRPERRKDAGDAAFMIAEYGKVLGNNERLFNKHNDLLERDDFDLDAAYAEMLGRDLAGMLSVHALKELRFLLATELGRGEVSYLLADMVHQGSISLDLCQRQLSSLVQGLKKVRPSPA